MQNNHEDVRKSIVEYIQYEISSLDHSADLIESLDVAKQCLENVWGIENSAPSARLLEAFVNRFGCEEKQQEDQMAHESIEIDDDDRMAAERLKAQGNICMGENLFSDAVSCYSKAIELDPRNAVYYCNRAAAFSKLNKNESAIEDCQHALKIDPKYGKAYSRMGLAYTAMNNFEQAIVCYKRAIDIEPDNQNYKQNLQAAEERKLTGNTGSTGGPSMSAHAGGVGGGSGGSTGIPNIQAALQNFDISSLLNNPAMMNMARQMMSQPEMCNIMSQMMSTMMPQTGSNQPAASADAANPSSVPGADLGVGDTTNINDFLAFGQQMAQQMQSTNPELVNNLRQQFQSSGTPPHPNTDNNNPPNSSN